MTFIWPCSDPDIDYIRPYSGLGIGGRHRQTEDQFHMTINFGFCGLAGPLLEN